MSCLSAWIFLIDTVNTLPASYELISWFFLFYRWFNLHSFLLVSGHYYYHKPLFMQYLWKNKKKQLIHKNFLIFRFFLNKIKMYFFKRNLFWKKLVKHICETSIFLVETELLLLFSLVNSLIFYPLFLRSRMCIIRNTIT